MSFEVRKRFMSQRTLLAVGETVILLHPPSPFSRCFNRGEEGG